MVRVTIVGDGPGGLGAAIFLAKGGCQVTIFGADATPTRSAHLLNYLGAPDTPGDAFQDTARAQAEGFGTRILSDRAASAVSHDDRIVVTLENGDEVESDYLVLAEGRAMTVAPTLDLDMTDDDRVVVDRDQRTSLSRVYAVGRATRLERSQAIISAGQGAVAALDILSTEAGTDVKDWDKH